MRILRRLAGLLLFVGLLFVFVRFPASNADPVTLDYLAGSLPGVPLWAALAGAFAAGFALAALVAFYYSARMAMLNRRYRKAVKGLEAEVHQLRNLPLVGAPEEEPSPLPAGSPAETASNPGS